MNGRKVATEHSTYISLSHNRSSVSHQLFPFRYFRIVKCAICRKILSDMKKFCRRLDSGKTTARNVPCFTYSLLSLTPYQFIFAGISNAATRRHASWCPWQWAGRSRDRHGWSSNCHSNNSAAATAGRGSTTNDSAARLAPTANSCATNEAASPASSTTGLDPTSIFSVSLW